MKLLAHCGSSLIPACTIHKSFDAVFQTNYIQVYKQTDGFTTELEIRQDLRVMLQLRSIVDDRRADLDGRPNLGQPELILQACGVGAFQQAGTKVGVYPHRGPDGGVTHLLALTAMGALAMNTSSLQR